MMTTIQIGYQRRDAHDVKRYHPYLYRDGKRRYASKGRLHFRTATLAMEYALRWKKRAEIYMELQVLEQQVEYMDIEEAR